MTPTPTPESRVVLEVNLGSTAIGTLWQATLDRKPVSLQIVDVVAAERAGLDLTVLEALPTLVAPGLALPTGIVATPLGPGLVLAGNLARPLVLPGPVGDLASLVRAAIALAEGLLALHRDGLTHNAITPSLLCPGPGGAPQLAVTAEAAAIGDAHRDVADLLTALFTVDAAAAGELHRQLTPISPGSPSPALQLLLQLQALTAASAPAAGPGVLPAVPPTHEPPPPPASVSDPAAGPGPGPVAAAEGLAVFGFTTGAPAPATRPRRAPNAITQTVREQRARRPLLLGGAAALVALLLIGDLAVVTLGGHSRTRTASVVTASAAAIATPTTSPSLAPSFAEPIPPSTSTTTAPSAPSPAPVSAVPTSSPAHSPAPHHTPTHTMRPSTSPRPTARATQPVTSSTTAAAPVHVPPAAPIAPAPRPSPTSSPKPVVTSAITPPK